MNKCLAVIRSKGTFTNEKENKSFDYDNLIFYLTSGDRLYQNEELLVGEGKPLIIKVKKEDYDRCCKDDPKILYGKELHFLTENGNLQKIEIK